MRQQDDNSNSSGKTWGSEDAQPTRSQPAANTQPTLSQCAAEVQPKNIHDLKLHNPIDISTACHAMQLLCLVS